MKKQSFFKNLSSKFVVILFSGALLLSCSKDDGNEGGVNHQNFKTTYFDVTNGNFNERPLPGSNSSDLMIASITGNQTVLAGGTNIIHVAAGENAKEIIVGVKDQQGYYTIPMNNQTANRGGAALAEGDIRMLVSQQLANNFSLAISVSDGQGNFGPFEYMEIDLMEAGTGKLQVSLSWDQPNDVDLHVTEPNGTRIYYANPYSFNGGILDIDSNAGCGIDNINNENITYADDPNVVIENGEYLVEVHLWSNCFVPDNTSYSVVAHYEGHLVQPTSGTNPFYGTFVPSDGGGAFKTAMKFNIGSSAAKGAPAGPYIQSMPKVVKFKFDKTNKVFENFGSPKK